MVISPCVALLILCADALSLSLQQVNWCTGVVEFTLIGRGIRGLLSTSGWGLSLPLSFSLSDSIWLLFC